MTEPTYQEYRRAFYQAITAAVTWRGIGATSGVDTSAHVTHLMTLAAEILAVAPPELEREIRRSRRIVSRPRPPS